MTEKVAYLTVVAPNACHQCGRELSNYSDEANRPGAGICEKHGVSYDRSFSEAKKFEVELSECPHCGEVSVIDRDGDEFCTGCEFDEAEE